MSSTHSFSALQDVATWLHYLPFPISFKDRRPGLACHRLWWPHQHLSAPSTPQGFRRPHSPHPQRSTSQKDWEHPLKGTLKENSHQRAAGSLWSGGARLGHVTFTSVLKGQSQVQEFRHSLLFIHSRSWLPFEVTQHSEAPPPSVWWTIGGDPRTQLVPLSTPQWTHARRFYSTHIIPPHTVGGRFLRHNHPCAREEVGALLIKCLGAAHTAGGWSLCLRPVHVAPSSEGRRTTGQAPVWTMWPERGLPRLHLGSQLCLDSRCFSYPVKNHHACCLSRFSVENRI